VTDLFVYDAAFKPNLAAVKAAHGIAINHYLTGIYSSTSTQPAEALAAGLGSILTYEEGADELVGASRATGQAVGRKILAAVTALKIVPLDGTVAVYPSVDVNAPPTSCEQSFLGIRDVIDGKLSLRDYSEGAIIDDLASHHITQGRAWLAAPTSWPNYNPTDPNVVMVQLVGTDVPGTDRNHLVLDPGALGALWPANSPYGADMPLTDADAQLVAKAVWQGVQLDNRTAQYRLEAVNTATGQILAALGGVPTVNAIVSAVVAALPSGPAGTLTKSDVETAVRGVLSGTTLTPPVA
jgi:hypothetical protein